MKQEEQIDNQMPLGAKNYVFILVGIFMMVLGFLLMTGEEFVDASQFSYALYICPILLIAGVASITVGLAIPPRPIVPTDLTGVEEEDDEEWED